MGKFTLNGKIIENYPENINLLDFLRDYMKITSVKDGCSEGACGACTVISDGKAVRACVIKMSGIDGKNIITPDGLSQREKDVYAYAFAEAGAVQCGFCTPGMVMAAKALIDKNINPSEIEVKKAINANICRCTGYKKIIEAVLLAAKTLREEINISFEQKTNGIGGNFHRVDAYEKTLGTGLYTDDLTFDDMIYGKAVRLPCARALIKGFDISLAKEHPDFIGVVSAKDLPGAKKTGHIVKDWDVLIDVGEVTRYAGDAVLLAASKTKASLDEIVSLIKVDYDELPPILSPEEALAENAPKLHEKGNILKHVHLKHGEPDKEIENAAFVVTKIYETPFTEHAFLEPECAIALPYGENGLHLYTGGQSIYDEQREISEMLGLPKENIRVTSMLVGGGFGGKEDMSVQHHAALLAWHFKKAVKVKFSRRESLLVHPKRHPFKIEMNSACDKDGNLVAIKAKIISDTGAYASLGGPVLERACTHAGGPYHYANLEIDGIAVYTNNPPAGAFRGFGVTQTAFACECNLNLLAELVGISPWEIRFKNAVTPGDVLPNWQIADKSTRLKQCLLAVKDIYENAEFAGIACSLKNSGIGVGLKDTGRCILSVEDGKIHIRSSAACIGQGMATVMVQIACEATGLSSDYFTNQPPDTERTPNSGTTTASRQTLFTGEAVRQAAIKLKTALAQVNEVHKLNGQEFYAEFCFETDPFGSDKPNPVSHAAYGYAAQVCVLNKNGVVEKISAAYDMGTVINKKSAQGQIEGGVVMGLGYALSENFPLEKGLPTAKFGTLGLYRAGKTPEIETIIIDCEDKEGYAYGAKGVGELATIPTAPAVQGAYYKYDKTFRTKLPLDIT